MLPLLFFVRASIAMTSAPLLLPKCNQRLPDSASEVGLAPALSRKGAFFIDTLEWSPEIGFHLRMFSCHSSSAILLTVSTGGKGVHNEDCAHETLYPRRCVGSVSRDQRSPCQCSVHVCDSSDRVNAGLLTFITKTWNPLSERVVTNLVMLMSGLVGVFCSCQQRRNVLRQQRHGASPHGLAPFILFPLHARGAALRQWHQSTLNEGSVSENIRGARALKGRQCWLSKTFNRKKN